VVLTWQVLLSGSRQDECYPNRAEIPDLPAAGRAAAELFTSAEPASLHGPGRLQVANLPPLLEQLIDSVAIRPPYGQHPRIFIWGLLEARLQHADVMILSGLNEGTWPALPTPDPWLAPRIRHELGLPSLERRIGLSAHDLASALGGRQVLVTRARRDARAPAIASRFWLRLEAMTGGLTRSPHHRRWAQALDRPGEHRPARQPAPNPPAAQRPSTISVTEVDRLKADPFAFYARKMLRLSPLDLIDVDPSAAWRGSAVHKVLEAWAKEEGWASPKALRCFEEACRLNSGFAPYWSNLGKALLAQGTLAETRSLRCPSYVESAMLQPAPHAPWLRVRTTSLGWGASLAGSFK